LGERELGEPEKQLLRGLRARRLEALGSPRQLARYICGITSPATSRAKLTKEPAFGVLCAVPFQRVLEWISQSG
jgi:ATP-dependent DNA helicase RecQ